MTEIVRQFFATPVPTFGAVLEMLLLLGLFVGLAVVALFMASVILAKAIEVGVRFRTLMWRRRLESYLRRLP